LNEEKDGFVLSADNLGCTLCIEGPGSAETRVTQDDKLASFVGRLPEKSLRHRASPFFEPSSDAHVSWTGSES
jgi:hypothetical protein